MQLASEPDRRHVLWIVRENLRPPKRVFVGVIDPINPKVETPQEVRDRVLEAADFVPLVQLGTTDDCGFSPFGDDLSTARVPFTLANLSADGAVDRPTTFSKGDGSLVLTS